MKIHSKFRVLFCALALATAFGAGSAQAQKLKIATVDVQQLFKDFHKTSVEQKKFADEFARIQKQNQERVASVRGLEETLQGLKKQIEDPTLNVTLKRKKSEEFKTKLDEAKAADRERREFVERQTRALDLNKRASMKGILENIKMKVTEYSKKENFDFVLDKSGVSSNQVPIILYTKDATDVTAIILAILNEDAPKAAK